MGYLLTLAGVFILLCLMFCYVPVATFEQLSSRNMKIITAAFLLIVVYVVICVVSFIWMYRDLAFHG